MDGNMQYIFLTWPKSFVCETQYLLHVDSQDLPIHYQNCIVSTSQFYLHKLGMIAY